MSGILKEWECWDCDFLVEGFEEPTVCPNCFCNDFVYKGLVK